MDELNLKGIAKFVFATLQPSCQRSSPRGRGVLHNTVPQNWVESINSKNN